MPAPANAPRRNPQRYEIAEPQSYSAFPLDPGQKQPADFRARISGNWLACVGSRC